MARPAIFVVPPCPSLRNLIIRDLLIDTNNLISLIRALDNLQSLVIIEPCSLRKLCRVNIADEWRKTVLQNGIITSDVLEAVLG